MEDRRDKFSGEKKKWLNTQESSEYLGISVGSLRNLTWAKRLRFYKFGRLNRYKQEDLDSLLTQKVKKGGL